MAEQIYVVSSRHVSRPVFPLKGVNVRTRILSKHGESHCAHRPFFFFSPLSLSLPRPHRFRFPPLSPLLPSPSPSSPECKEGKKERRAWADRSARRRSPPPPFPPRSATLEEANEAARERVEEECVFAAFPGRFRRDESVNALGGFECECQVSAASAVEGVRARFTVSVNAIECAADKAAHVAALARVEDPRRVLKRNHKGFKMLLPYGKPQGLRRGPLCAKSECSFSSSSSSSSSSFSLGGVVFGGGGVRK